MCGEGRLGFLRPAVSPQSPLVGRCAELTVCAASASTFIWLCLELCVFVHLFYADFRAEVQNKLHQDREYPCEVVGSWNTWYGEQDQAGKQQFNHARKVIETFKMDMTDSMRFSSV